MQPTLPTIICVIAACYILYSVVRGRVTVRNFGHSRSIDRRENPRNFWFVIVLYTAMLALLSWFVFVGPPQPTP